MAVTVDLDYFTQRDWWSRVDRSDTDGCWPWLLSVGSHRYGQTWDGISVLLAHRVAWVLHHGEQIPDDLTIDHVCRNRRCCRPDRLRLLSNVENAAGNANKIKTHCKWGHEFTPDNTRTNARGHRWCRQCTTASNAARPSRGHLHQ